MELYISDAERTITLSISCASVDYRARHRLHHHAPASTPGCEVRSTVSLHPYPPSRERFWHYPTPSRSDINTWRDTHSSDPAPMTRPISMLTRPKRDRSMIRHLWVTDDTVLSCSP